MAYDPQVARRIVEIGRSRGLGQREIVAALSTGLVESGLRNINHGDRDSLGVFQQRPSQGWGTKEQVTDVDYATNKFYDSIGQFDKQGISGAELAARIQRPAAQYRDRYAKRWGEAEGIFRQFSGGGSGGYSGGGEDRMSADVVQSTGMTAASPVDAPFSSAEMWRTILSSLADQMAGGQREPFEDEDDGIGSGSAFQPLSSGRSDDSALGLINETANRWGQREAIAAEGMPMGAESAVAGAPVEGTSRPLPDLGNVTPGQGGVPKGLRDNAARGAAAVRKVFNFRGTIGGLGQRANKSDHPHGNAIDVMTNANVEQGREIAEWFVENRDALGVKYVIFDRTIWSPKKGWAPRKMEDRGSPTANHVDHPHISFN